MAVIQPWCLCLARIPNEYFSKTHSSNHQTPPEKTIGFIVPNSNTNDSVMAFAVPVEEVEKVTHLRFFSESRKNRAIDKISVDISDWK